MTEPVAPVDAASVILVRDRSDGGWECFMERRHVRSDFAADVYVFPGGKVDIEDHSPDVWSIFDTTTGDDTALRAAAIRELFEEAGVLLVVDKWNPLEMTDDLLQLRLRLRAGSITLVEVANAARTSLAASALHPFSRWITPEAFPRRFDTHFYVARCPKGQEASHDAEETTDSLWIDAPTALAEARAGRFPLVFATEKHLERMARFISVQDLIESVMDADLQPVMPRIVQHGDEASFALPGDPDY
ncbi:MAG TPA: NUDIX domain-containing protein [Chloroflexota bacterium]